MGPDEVHARAVNVEVGIKFQFIPWTPQQHDAPVVRCRFDSQVNRRPTPHGLNHEIRTAWAEFRQPFSQRLLAQVERQVHAARLRLCQTRRREIRRGYLACSRQSAKLRTQIPH